MEQSNQSKKTNIIFCTNNDKKAFLGGTYLSLLGIDSENLFANRNNWVKLSNPILPNDFIIILLNEDIYNTDGWEIYLRGKINELTDCPNLVCHSNTPNDLILFLKQEIKCKFGLEINPINSLHEPYKIYALIPKLCQSLRIGNNDIEEIINEFKGYIIPSIEKYLILLHQCLTPQGAKEANPDWLKGEVKTKFEALRSNDLINKVDNDPFHPDYIKALTDLRDELLKEY
jgi:hypothetical protein